MMGLVINNRATAKQLQWLIEHDYYGSLRLNKQEAEDLITELMEQERLNMSKEHKGFVERLDEFDPYYLERYKQFKRGEI